MHKKIMSIVTFSIALLALQPSLNGMIVKRKTDCDPKIEPAIGSLKYGLEKVNNTSGIDKVYALKDYGTVHRRLENMLKGYAQEGDVKNITHLYREIEDQVKPVASRGQYNVILKTLKASRKEGARPTNVIPYRYQGQ